MPQLSDLSSHLCPKCGSHCIRPSHTIIDGRSVEEVKCLICGYRPRLSENDSHISTPNRSHPISKSRPRKILTPRKPNKTADDTDRLSYEASKHFWQRSQTLKKLRSHSKSKSERAKLRHYQGLFDALVDTLEGLRIRWSKIGKGFSQTQRTSGHATEIKDKIFNELQFQYWLLMRQGMVWQPNDPAVRAFANSRKALGDYDFLRGARKGLETGIRRPYPNAQEALADLTILDLGADGMSPGKIREALKAQGLQAPSREWIRKRLKAFSIPVSIATSLRTPRK